MTAHVIETVTFRLNDGVSREQFLAQSDAVATFLEECPGFVSRRLACDESGEWLDLIEWRKVDQAKAASEQLMSRTDLAAFLTNAATPIRC